MKLLLIAAMMIFSSLSFAQDGYHIFNKTECEANESCLVNRGYDHVLKLIPVENRQGEVVGARLSSDSFLADTVYKKADLCFQGSAVEVCEILELSANADGGDGVINTFKCEAKNPIKLEYEVEYYGYGTEVLNFEIKKCE